MSNAIEDMSLAILEGRKDRVIQGFAECAVGLIEQNNCPYYFSDEEYALMKSYLNEVCA
jgi:hypothetical protein